MISVQNAYSFGPEMSGLTILREGWSAPAENGVWTEGDASGLVIPTPAAPGTLLLELRLDPQEIFGVTRPRDVIIHLNGAPLPPRRLAGAGTWHIPVPAHNNGDPVQLTVHAAPHGVRLVSLHVLRDTHATPPPPVQQAHDIHFGWNETTQDLLTGDGWGTPEDAFVWAIGGDSTLRLPVPPDGAALIALLDMRPHTRDGAPSLQRVEVEVDGRLEARLDLWERLSVAIGLHPAQGQTSVMLHFRNLDAHFRADDPYFHFGKPFAWALASIRVMPAPPRYLPGSRPRLPGSLANGSMQAMAERLTGVPAPDLAAGFEGLGNGCELGLLQQQLGRDRTGLLRFVAIRQRELVEACFAAFRGVARRDRLSWTVRRPEDATWRLIEGSYGISAATPHDRFQPPPARALDLEARRLPRLADKLMEDVAAADRIFVMRFSEPGGEPAARAVLAALRHYGEADMVWLVIDEDRQPGSVDRLASGLLRGYVDVPVPGRESSPDTMLSILANAWVLLRQAARLPAAEPEKQGVLF